jgi:hypothetical protein
MPRFANLLTINQNCASLTKIAMHRMLIEKDNPKVVFLSQLHIAANDVHQTGKHLAC